MCHTHGSVITSVPTANLADSACQKVVVSQ